MARGLSKKQRIFIDEYLKCWNSAEAARRAGYSERSAYSIGTENLRKPAIAFEIKQRIERSAMSADEVLKRLADQARAKIGDFIEITGDKWKFDIRALAEAEGIVKKIKSNKFGLEIEFYDAQAALVHIGRHLVLFTDRIEHSWRNEMMELIREGVLTIEQVQEEVGDGLARELFESAGVSVASGGEIEEAGEQRADEQVR